MPFLKKFKNTAMDFMKTRAGFLYVLDRDGLKNIDRTPHLKKWGSLPDY